VRFLVDMPVTPRAVEFLAGRGHEAVHASTIGLSEASDTLILERARAEDRVVVTARPSLVLASTRDWTRVRSGVSFACALMWKP
jgi:predicted nuclease of predicted toxin-antitoxin system